LARPLANAISAKGFRSVAWVVSQNSFFVSLADATAEQLGNVVTTSRSELLPDFTDFRSVLKKIQTEKPDVVVAFLQENSGLGSFVRQFKDLNIASQLMVMAISYQSDLQQLLPIVDGVPSLEVLAIGTPEFRSRFEERFKSKPLGGAAKAYDSLMVLKNAIERCGESRADLQKCLPTTDIAGVGGHVRFGPDRENADESPWMKMMMVKDGKFFELNDQLEVGAEFPF
jgi:ABC-type branched-subunit amino acid transport system substrate-binding protein